VATLSRISALLALTLVACCSVDTPEHPPSSGGAGGKADDAERAPLSAITAWNAELAPSDREAKYCKMAVSPFAFFRGTNHLYWSDLAGDSRLEQFGNSKTTTWIQGDLHPLNYGAFDDDKGSVVYSLNDFDESVIADYQLDLWRMATGLVLSARANNLSASDQRDIVDAFTESYLDTMASYRGNDKERGLMFTAANTHGRLDNFLEEVTDDKSRKRALEKWTVVGTDGQRRLDFDSPKLEPVTALEGFDLRAAMEDYQQTVPSALRGDASYFAVKSIARRLLAGTGSLGTPRFYVLIEGPSNDDDDDRILDVKRQGAPTAYRLGGAVVRATYDDHFINHARRAALAQRALLTNADDHLGWLHLPDGDYSVRERSVYKESFPVDELDSASSFETMAEQWGAILATTHARADKDYDPSLVGHSVDKQIDEVTDHHHSEVRALVREIAFAYADTVAADYAAFMDDLAPSDCP
jgi:uncharacterized protein (DUF2252 family)